MSHDLARGEIEDQGTVRADRQSVAARGVGDFGHPDWTTSADEDDRDARVASRCKSCPRPLGHRLAVGPQERSIEIGRDQTNQGVILTDGAACHPSSRQGVEKGQHLTE